MSSLIRSLKDSIGYFVFYPIVKISMLTLAIIQDGFSIALVNIFLGYFEQELVACIIGYWFCDRGMIINKRRRIDHV